MLLLVLELAGFALLVVGVAILSISGSDFGLYCCISSMVLVFVAPLASFSLDHVTMTTAQLRSQARAMTKSAELLPTPTSTERIITQAREIVRQTIDYGVPLSIATTTTKHATSYFTLRVPHTKRHLCLTYSSATTNWSAFVGACPA